MNATVSNTKAAPVQEFGPMYVANRAPLVPSPFIKLPIGNIVPKGWLRHQLELEAAGMTGRLPEISKWCKFESNAWASASGQGQSGWEELPYWLKGFGDLGYVLHDEAIIAEARKWIDAVLKSQELDGYFGPRANKTALKGKPDLWPHMVMLNVLQSFYEYSGDDRVVPFITKYSHWLNRQPPDTFGNGYWPRLRFGDNIETVYWLYNRTGDTSLLELARKIHENMAPWSKDVIDWHNVNLSQGFREPAVFYLQSGDKTFLNAAERNYEKIMGLYGQFPGGGFAGDENCRPGYTDPRQGFETCGIVEFMHSFEMLTKISGDPIWSDRCEELAFNSLPAALTPDLKALHYLTCANSVQLDRNNKAPAIQNGGTMLSYSPFEVYRCCQHNVSHGWPYFAEELWLATPARGLCASIYAPSEVTAKVGSGAEVTIIEDTDYPFGDTIHFKISARRPVAFPLQFRIPRWCVDPSARINGKPLPLQTKPLSYATIERTWRSGDELTLRLPMNLSLRTWTKNNNAVSVDYGPLTFSLKIGEKWQRYGKDDKWPEWEVLPTTAWNYGLELDGKNPIKSLELHRKAGTLPENPFKPETVPIEIKAKARKIVAWQQDKLGLVGKLQPSPVKSDEPIETVSLIPMGAARLRISSFPAIGHGNDAHEWSSSAALPIIASHCFSGDSVEAMVDGIEPKSSSDATIPRFTWWDHRGTAEWVEWGFAKRRQISAVEIYWFDDTG
ncbi:MAG TPA: beta-L-arabinofuranosidase domain-containing protein, partial [Verrucomicrobiae bacterium]